jgi:hypothetical protein
MIKLTTHLEAIIKKNGGTSKDWKDIMTMINSRPDE